MKNYFLLSWILVWNIHYNIAQEAKGIVYYFTKQNTGLKLVRAGEVCATESDKKPENTFVVRNNTQISNARKGQAFDSLPLVLNNKNPHFFYGFFSETCSNALAQAQELLQKNQSSGRTNAMICEYSAGMYALISSAQFEKDKKYINSNNCFEISGIIVNQIGAGERPGLAFALYPIRTSDHTPQQKKLYNRPQ